MKKENKKLTKMILDFEERLFLRQVNETKINIIDKLRDNIFNPNYNKAKNELDITFNETIKRIDKIDYHNYIDLSGNYLK